MAIDKTIHETIPRHPTRTAAILTKEAAPPRLRIDNHTPNLTQIHGLAQRTFSVTNVRQMAIACQTTVHNGPQVPLQALATHKSRA